MNVGTDKEKTASRFDKRVGFQRATVCQMVGIHLAIAGYRILILGILGQRPLPTEQHNVLQCAVNGDHALCTAQFLLH